MFCSSFRNRFLASGILLLSQAAVSAALAENRVALVIGQSSYRSVTVLPNPANDAQKMTELLGDAGFKVTTAADLTQNDMRQVVGDFAAKVSASGPDTVALVFYAGHGLQIDGENYLVPVDVDPKRETDIPLQAVRLNDVMNTLAAVPTRMRIIMLDACRNNPFPNISTTAGHGLAIVDTKAGAAGSFISYSTSPGAVAEDGSGSNSPYTTALLSVAKEPNLTIEEAFKRVRVSVNQATDGRQTPWESSSLTTEFKFFGGDQGSTTPSGQKVAVAGKATSAGRSMEDWRKELRGKDPKIAYDLVVADDTVPAYEAFVALFAQPPYNMRVRVQLERRYVMQAWATAVAINTAASFQTFLTSYPNSDLAVTARKLRERVLNREFGAQPTNIAALGPMCPCPPQPVTPLKKKVEEPKPTKRVKRAEPTGRAVPTKQRSEPGIPPEAVIQGIGIGIGIGGALMGGGGGGGGGGHHHPEGGSGGGYGGGGGGGGGVGVPSVGGGGCSGGSCASDTRLKHDIVRVGHTANGLGLYRFRFNWSDQVYVGVLAQEVEKVAPEAVIHGTDGFLRVNYDALGMQLKTWNDWRASKTRRTDRSH